jgi:hypothetical protein
MPLADDIREFTPGTDYRKSDPATRYWICGTQVFWRHLAVAGAEPETFRFYLGDFAKDRRRCYCCTSVLRGANPTAFRALNYTYAADNQFVWTKGGKIKDAEARSFVACDDGYIELGLGLRAPYGFGKDNERVYYYDFDGKANWVRKASSDSFVSLNDGYFGKDANFAFFGRAMISKANVECWEKVDGYYSKDDKRVYYRNCILRDADPNTFVFLDPKEQLARDKRHLYRRHEIVGWH